MKQYQKWIASAVVIAASLTVCQRAAADATITTFDDFTSNELYPSWNTATINSTPTNYVITSTGYGSNYKYIGFPLINEAGNTNIQLDVTLSGPPAADGNLGPIVDLIDGDGTRMSYRWYGRPLGQQVLNGSIFTQAGSLDFGYQVVTQAVGSVAGLNLTNLEHMHMQLDPGGFGTSGAYTIAWNNLALTGAAGGGGSTNGSGVCATVSTFDNFNLDTLYGWADATIVSGPTNYSITDTGYGSGVEDINPNITGTTSNQMIQVTVTLSGQPAASGQLGPIVTLVDGDGTGRNFAWYGQTLGTHVLSMPISAGTPNVDLAGTIPGFDPSTLDFFHLQLDPGSYTSQPYTVVWDSLVITGCGAASGIVITSQSYNPGNRQMSLTWSSTAGKQYTILYAATISETLTPFLTNIASGGATTSQTVTLPVGATGFVQIQEQ